MGGDRTGSWPGERGRPRALIPGEGVREGLAWRGKQLAWWTGGQGGRSQGLGVKLVIPASAVTCPTRQCMMSLCSKLHSSASAVKETPDCLAVCTVVRAVTHRLHLNVVAELLGVIPGRLCSDRGIRETPGVSLCDRDRPEVKDPWERSKGRSE